MSKSNRDIDLLDAQDAQATPEPPEPEADETQEAAAPVPEVQPVPEPTPEPEVVKPQPVSGELHVCSDGQSAVATYGVVRWKGEPEELACKRCLGPLNEIVSYRVLNAIVEAPAATPNYGM